MAQNTQPETLTTPAANTTHAGRVITVARKFRPAYSYDYTNSYSGETRRVDVEAWEVWAAAVDGKEWYGLSSGKDVQDAINRAKRAIDRLNSDEAIYDSLQSYVGRVEVKLGAAERDENGRLHKPVVSENITLATQPKIGDRVVTYSRGYWRKALVAKVGRKNVEVAYVTSVGGTLTRKSVPASSVYVEVA
jgi:hypothetical protein